MILKNYNSSQKKPKKTRELDIEKEFENDNYLIQTLKRTSKFKNDKKLSEYENNLQELLYYINRTILFNSNPKIKIIHDENEEFLKPYKYLSKTFEAQTEQVLQDLIVKYTQRGYRIPKFSYKNNIFKTNALIEENSEKLRLMLVEELKKKQNIIGPKTLSYLNKIFYLVKIMITKDNNLIKKYSKLLNKKEPNVKKESIGQLKADIEKLISLLKNLKIISHESLKRKSSFLAKSHYNNFNKLLNSKNSSNSELVNLNKTSDKNNNNNLLTEESKSAVKERNNIGFLSMRLSNNGIQSNKLIRNTLKAKDPITPFEKVERINTEKNINQKCIFFKKNKPLINLKMRSIFSNEKNLRIKTANQREKDNKKKSRKSTFSDLGKYINQAKKNKNYYQSTKYNNLYSLGLKKNSGNINRHQILSNKDESQHLGYSYDTIQRAYSKKQSEEKWDISRNQNFQNEFKKLKTGRTDILEEKKTLFLLNAYTKIKRGKYESVEDYMKKYLKEIKEVDSTEGEKIMKYYNYKNLKNNLLELNVKVNDDKTRKKIEKIYSNIHILKRILPTLKSMKDKENNIDRLEKIFTSGVNKYN